MQAKLRKLMGQTNMLHFEGGGTVSGRNRGGAGDGETLGGGG